MTSRKAEVTAKRATPGGRSGAGTASTFPESVSDESRPPKEKEVSPSDSSKNPTLNVVVGKVTSWLADTGASVDAIDRRCLSAKG